MRFYPRLSYANVVATLALFIALGTGGAYAASKINGATIKDRSIPASKIKKSSLTAAEVREAASAIRLNQLVFSKSRKRNKTRDSNAAPPSAASTSIIKLSIGEAATLLQSGPFTLTLKCGRGAARGNANYDKPAVSILASTTEAGTLIDHASIGPGNTDDDQAGTSTVSPSDPVYVVQPQYSGPLTNSPGSTIMLAPSGAQLNAQYFYGQSALGADCLASAWAVV